MGVPQLASAATPVAAPVTDGSMDPGQDTKAEGQEMIGGVAHAQVTVTVKLADEIIPQASTAV